MLIFKSYVHSGNKRYKKGETVPETFTEKQLKHLRCVGAIGEADSKGLKQKPKATAAIAEKKKSEPVIAKQAGKPAEQPTVEPTIAKKTIKSIRDIEGLVEEDFKVLENAGYDTVEKLAAVQYKDLIPLPRIGRAKAKLIVDALKK